jgi:DNA-binding transcriptional ArsR family regulator
VVQAVAGLRAGLDLADALHHASCRSGGVGIYRGDQFVNMAPPALMVSSLVADLLAWLPIEAVTLSRQQGYSESPGQADQQGDLEPFVAYQLEAIHDGLRSLIGSEKGSELAEKIGATYGAFIDAVILRDLATEPTLSARRLAEHLQLSQRAVGKHLAALQQKGRLLRDGSPRYGSLRSGSLQVP